MPAPLTTNGYPEVPPRFEDVDPALAEQIRQIVNGEHPKVLGFTQNKDGVHFKLRPVTAQPTVGRNDPCPCGSGKKYKKCCLS